MPNAEQSSTPSFDVSRLYLSTSFQGDDNAGHLEFDALLQEPGLIPAGWGEGVLVFAAAHDTDGDDNPCVWSLAREGGQWSKRLYYLSDDDWLPSDRFVHVRRAS